MVVVAPVVPALVVALRCRGVVVVSRGRGLLHRRVVVVTVLVVILVGVDLLAARDVVVAVDEGGVEPGAAVHGVRRVLVAAIARVDHVVAHAAGERVPSAVVGKVAPARVGLGLVGAALAVEVVV